MERHGHVRSTKADSILYYRVSKAINHQMLKAINDDIRQYYESHDRFVTVFDLEYFDLMTHDSIESMLDSEELEFANGKEFTILQTSKNIIINIILDVLNANNHKGHRYFHSKSFEETLGILHANGYDSNLLKIKVEQLESMIKLEHNSIIERKINND